MKKLFTLLFIFIFFSLVKYSLAVVIPPDNKIWLSNENAKAGEEIQLNVFIYNTTSESAKMDVVFKISSGETKSIQDFAVPAESAKIATIDYTYPEKTETVNIFVENARNNFNKKIPLLNKEIGSLSINEHNSDLSKVQKIKNTFILLLNNVEKFRLHQYEKYSKINEENKKVLGGLTLTEVSQMLKPDESKNTEENKEIKIEKDKSQVIIDYIKLIFSSLAKAFFAKKVVFYSVLIIISLYILRIIFSNLF